MGVKQGKPAKTYTFNGKKVTVKEFCTEHGVSESGVRKKLADGKTLKEISKSFAK